MKVHDGKHLYRVSLSQLQLEVDRLEELKMQNMKKVIEAIRVELAQYWDQCFYSQEQRQAFAPYYAGSYTGGGFL